MLVEINHFEDFVGLCQEMIIKTVYMILTSRKEGLILGLMFVQDFAGELSYYDIQNPWADGCGYYVQIHYTCSCSNLSWCPFPRSLSYTSTANE